MSTDLARHALNGPTMGTRYSAILFAPHSIDLRPVTAALQAGVDKVDAQMSSWKPQSDLCRFNAAPIGDWIDIPAEFAEVIARGLEIGRASGGAFDIGLGALVNAWGFGPDGPDVDTVLTDALRTARRQPAHQALELDRANLRLRKHAPISLDLSGIAKGYGADVLASCLDHFDIRNYLVSIDGEMRASGGKPDGGSWAVAIERPGRTARDIARVISLRDMAVATSGDYRHVVEHDGTAYSHTMDPRTGSPLRNGLSSVTVLAPDCMSADAWATVLMVLGEDEGPSLAESLGLSALFIARLPNGLGELVVGPDWPD